MFFPCCVYHTQREEKKIGAGNMAEMFPSTGLRRREIKCLPYLTNNIIEYFIEDSTLLIVFDLQTGIQSGKYIKFNLLAIF